MLDIKARDLEELQAILSARIPGCEVRAYGSRVNGTAQPGSDLDLVVMGRQRIDPRLMAELGADLEDSDLPFAVDVLDWNAVPEDFRRAISQSYEVISS
jgi:type I restriction enzyme S subunit